MITTETIEDHSGSRRPKGRKQRRALHSKMIQDRLTDAEVLETSISKLKDQVRKGFAERLAPVVGEGEVVPDHAFMLELVARSVRAAKTSLREAEDHYCRETVWLKAHRRECERVSREELYPQVVAVRRAIDGLFGKEVGVCLHGMEGKTLRKARRLEAQLHFLVVRLRNRDFDPPAARLAGSVVDRDAWLSQIEPGYIKLVKLLKELQRREFRQSTALEFKWSEIKEFDAKYRESLRYVEGAYAFAGAENRVVSRLRSYLERRQLKQRARKESAARAEGRRASAKDSVVGKLVRWSGWGKISRAAARRGR